MLGELYECGHAREPNDGFPLLVKAVGSDGVDQCTQATVEAGEATLCRVVEIGRICLVENLLSHEAHSITFRTEHHVLVIPAMNE